MLFRAYKLNHPISFFFLYINKVCYYICDVKCKWIAASALLARWRAIKGGYIIRVINLRENNWEKVYKRVGSARKMSAFFLAEREKKATGSKSEWTILANALGCCCSSQKRYISEYFQLNLSHTLTFLYNTRAKRKLLSKDNLLFRRAFRLPISSARGLSFEY